MTTIEELGLLKMDFLGLRTLTVIQNAVRMAQKSSGKQINIDEIDYQDKGVLELIGSGKTEGIFQLESAGMKNFMKELKPQSLEDIIAGISLYRPGPMDFIPAYIKGKNHPEEVTYDCPQLEPILAPTYGCIVYQEQVMQIVRDLAGYTLGRSDLVRRAMSKKKGSVMEQERKNFVYGNEEEGVPGCIANGIDEKIANKIYDEMMDFAKYAFNIPCSRICSRCIPDGMVKILLPGRVYGILNDLRYGQFHESIGVYTDLSENEYRDTATGYQRRRRRIFCCGKCDPLWTVCDQGCGKACH